MFSTVFFPTHGFYALSDEVLNEVGNYLSGRDYFNYITSSKSIYRACAANDLRKRLHQLPHLSISIRLSFAEGPVLTRELQSAAKYYHEVERHNSHYIPIDQSSLARINHSEWTARAVYETYCAQRIFIEDTSSLNVFDLLTAESKIRTVVENRFRSWKAPENTKLWKDPQNVFSLLLKTTKIQSPAIFLNLVAADGGEGLSCASLDSLFLSCAFLQKAHFIDALIALPRFHGMPDSIYIKGLQIAAENKCDDALRSLVRQRRFRQLPILSLESIFLASLEPKEELEMLNPERNRTLKVLLDVIYESAINYDSVFLIIKKCISHLNFEAFELLMNSAHITKRRIQFFIKRSIRESEHNLLSSLLLSKNPHQLSHYDLDIFLNYSIKCCNSLAFKLILDNNHLPKIPLDILESLEKTVSSAHNSGEISLKDYLKMEDAITKKILITKYL